MHSLVNSYKKVLAVAVETDYSWPEIEELKDRIANPDAYAAAAPVAAAAGGAAAAETKEEEKVEEKEEEESDEGGFGGLLFVPPCLPRFMRPILTSITATKCNGIMTVFRTSNYMGLGQVDDLRLPLSRLHRSQLFLLVKSSTSDGNVSASL